MITKEALQFLADLIANNNSEWMHANKKRYENYKKDYHNFIASILAEMKPLDKSLELLEVKNCTFRIKRDIRFSKDKSPYKLNRSAGFSKIAKKDIEHPGYYIEINSRKCMIAGGAWCPSSDHLKKIRQEIYYNLDEFNQIISENEFVYQFKTVHGEKAKRLQEPFIDYAKESEWIKNKQFYFIDEFDPKKCIEPNFLNFLTTKFKAGYALNQFLRRAMHD
jgi:uncharacterized protein (TIGR02453 family)